MDIRAICDMKIVKRMWKLCFGKDFSILPWPVTVGHNRPGLNYTCMRVTLPCNGRNVPSLMKSRM